MELHKSKYITITTPAILDRAMAILERLEKTKLLIILRLHKSVLSARVLVVVLVKRQTINYVPAVLK